MVNFHNIFIKEWGIHEIYRMQNLEKTEHRALSHQPYDLLLVMDSKVYVKKSSCLFKMFFRHCHSTNIMLSVWLFIFFSFSFIKFVPFLNFSIPTLSLANRKDESAVLKQQHKTSVNPCEKKQCAENISCNGVRRRNDYLEKNPGFVSEEKQMNMHVLYATEYLLK